MDILSIKDKVCKENRVKKKDQFNSTADNSNSNSQNVLLTTLRVDSADVKKVQLKIRTAEGQQGSLNAFVMEKSAGAAQS